MLFRNDSGPPTRVNGHMLHCKLTVLDDTVMAQ